MVKLPFWNKVPVESNSTSSEAKQKALQDLTHDATVENLQEKLDSPQFSNDLSANKYEVFSNNMTKTDVNNDWIDDDIQAKSPSLNTELKQRRMSVLNKSLIIAGALLLLASIVAVFIWSSDRNAIDADKIITRITPPSLIESSTLLNLDVAIENLNAVPLTNAVLVTRYGEGVANNEGRAITRTELGVINPNQVERVKIPFILLGTVGQQRKILFELEYSSPNSAIRFVADYEQLINIEESPLSLKSEFPREQSTGEPQAFTVTLSTTKQFGANPYEIVFDLASGSVLSDLSVDEQFVSNLDGDPVVEISPPQPGQPVTLTGIIKINQATPGLIANTISVISNNLVLAQSRVETQVTLPPIMIKDFTREEEILPNKKSSFRFQLTNTTDSIIRDAVVVIQLDGSEYKLSSVQNGLYNSATGTITFTPQTSQGLSQLDPNDSTEINFTLEPVSGSRLVAEFNITGIRVKSGPDRRQLNDQEFVYQIESELQVNAYATYRRSNLINRGPLPPRVGEETTYTVTLSTSITDSSISPSSITSRLPNNVSIFGDLPPGLTLTNNTIVWQAPGREDIRAFQVVLNPDQSQVGSSAPLLTDIIFNYGFEPAANSIRLPNVTTDLTADSGYNVNESQVSS